MRGRWPEGSESGLSPNHRKGGFGTILVILVINQNRPSILNVSPDASRDATLKTLDPPELASIMSKKRAIWSAQLQLRILVRGPVFASTCAAGAAHSHVFSLTSAVCLRPSRSTSGVWGHSPKGDGPSVPLRPQTDISTLETALWIRHSLHQSVSMTAYLSDMN